MASTIPVKRNTKGIWYSRIYLGKDSAGRKIQKQKSFPEAETEAEARLAAAEWAASLTAGGKVQSMRLSDLLGEYIDMRELNGASPNSVKQWRCFKRAYIDGKIGTVNATELTALDFTRFLGATMRCGGRHGGRLSANTVNALYQFLVGAYRYFAGVGLVPSNPLADTAKPHREQAEATFLDEADVDKLNDYIDPIVMLVRNVPDSEFRGALAVWIALHTGLRIGEVCALRPKDINIGRMYVHVGGTVIEPENGEPFRREKPKSTRGRRNVSIVETEAETLAAVLKDMAAEHRWATPTAPIISIDGTWTRPSTVSSWFSRLVRKLSINPKATMHTLRHTHASWCIANGVDYVTLSERLGHSSPVMTMRVYGHLMEGRDRAAAEAFNRALRGGD